jgi:hypothetical protein
LNLEFFASTRTVIRLRSIARHGRYPVPAAEIAASDMLPLAIRGESG